MEYHPGTIKSMNAWTPAIKYCIPTLHSNYYIFFISKFSKQSGNTQPQRTLIPTALLSFVSHVQVYAS